ncbi:MAG: DNA primase [Syntrophus sp. GWC2_56_31]|nr:MAG: DNA primase [Syntrophus sp. GWC2_56_31]
MNGSIPDDKIEEIRRRADIASLIGEYVTLKKAGRNYLGLCPFHREKTPSFTVSPDKQMFYCFGCSEGGNVFSFLMKLNHLTFPEAVRHLAKKVGVIIPERLLSREEKERYSLAEQIRRVNELAAGLFMNTLRSPAGEDAREYLRKRGIGESAIETFRLGFSPEGWTHLSEYLDKKGVSPKLAQQAGLLVERTGKSQGYYDRFRGRVMIPIEDVDGRVIAFGGRVMGAGEPKYMNSPESAIYTKGNTLYGLARTREAIREKGFALLVEGYFDLIALWNAGITNVVAMLGTALTRAQVDLIRRYTTRVVAVFDPDEAGKKALARSLELFLAGNVHARAVILPDGQDPDEFVRVNGREKMDEVVAKAWPMADYYIDQILGGRGTLEEDRDKLREAVAFLSRLEDDVGRNLFVKKVAEALVVDEEVLKKEVLRTRSRNPSAVPPDLPRRSTAAEMDPSELSLIRMMLEYPEKSSTVRDSAILADFRTEKLKSLGEELLAMDREGRTMRDASSLVGTLTEGPLRDKLLALLVQESPFSEELIDRLIADTIRKIRQRSNKERGKTLTSRIKEAERAGNWELVDRLTLDKVSLT